MIHKITLENYFSIGAEQVIDFSVSGRSPDLPCFVSSRGDGSTRLPVVAGFFGSNASGKTTVLRSIVSVLGFVIASLSLKPNEEIPYLESFAGEKTEHSPTRITVEFDGYLPSDEKEYLFQYQLSVSRPKEERFGGAHIVEFEKLSYKPMGKWRALFERQGQKFRFGREFGISDTDQRTQFIRPNASVLSTLAQFNHKDSQVFIEFVRSAETNFAGYRIRDENENVTAAFYAQNPAFFEDLNRQIRRADVGIEKVEILQGNEGPFFIFHHAGLNRALFFSHESHGTQKFVTIFPRIKKALDTGSLAIIDEMDSVLHPILMEEIFKWFSDPKKNLYKAQLLFTAHNPVLLNYLEKEQIFLTEKTPFGGTSIYRVSDIADLNRNIDYAKKYLAGELGGLPIIG